MPLFLGSFRRKKNRRVRTISSRLVTRPTRKIENLRNDQLVARRSHLRERRQFVLPPTKVEIPDDFRARIEKTYTLVDGRPATVRQELPRNINQRTMHESNLLPALHDYFQERPELVTICERRAMRRRVLFALRRTGKGAARRDRKWSEDSKVRCV